PSPVEQAEHRKRHREISRDRVEPERRLLLYRRRRVGLAPGGAEERRAPRVVCAAQRPGGGFLLVLFFGRTRKSTSPAGRDPQVNVIHDARAKRARPSSSFDKLRTNDCRKARKNTNCYNENKNMNYDLLIIGAGIHGAGVAQAAAAAGYSVLV